MSAAPRRRQRPVEALHLAPDGEDEIHTGGDAVDNWLANSYQTDGYSRGTPFPDTVDTSGVTDPAPAAVYQSYASSSYDGHLTYALPVPDGTYTLRLHFVDGDAKGRKQRVVVAGKPRGDVEGFAGAGKPLEVPLAEAASAAGRVEVAIEALTPAGAVVSAVEIVPAAVAAKR